MTTHCRIRPVSTDEAAAFPKDVIVAMECPFADKRGAVRPLVDVPLAPVP